MGASRGPRDVYKGTCTCQGGLRKNLRVRNRGVNIAGITWRFA